MPSKIFSTLLCAELFKIIPWTVSKCVKVQDMTGFKLIIVPSTGGPDPWSQFLCADGSKLLHVTSFTNPQMKSICPVELLVKHFFKV